VSVPSISAHGAKIPALGYGTWPLAGRDCREAVRAALKQGYRHVDTAAMYGNEDAVGEALRESGIPRDEIFVTTKVWHDSLADGALQKSAKTSLKRLGLKEVDLLLIHWPNESVAMAEMIGALNDAKAQGLTRHIGVSNFSPRMLTEAWRHTNAPLVCNQVEFHPWLDQPKLAAAIRSHGMVLTAYCPLGRGRHLGDPRLAGIAAKRGKSPAQLVLRWLVQQGDIAAIPKSANPQRIAENLAIFDFTLTQEEMAAIAALARSDGRAVNAAWGPDWKSEA
jgi:diketogulonate reductase-like aldo/keto reductase